MSPDRFHFLTLLEIECGAPQFDLSIDHSCKVLNPLLSGLAPTGSGGGLARQPVFALLLGEPGPSRPTNPSRTSPSEAHSESHVWLRLGLLVRVGLLRAGASARGPPERRAGPRA